MTTSKWTQLQELADHAESMFYCSKMKKHYSGRRKKLLVNHHNSNQRLVSIILSNSHHKQHTQIESSNWTPQRAQLKHKIAMLSCTSDLAGSFLPRTPIDYNIYIRRNVHSFVQAFSINKAQQDKPNRIQPLSPNLPHQPSITK